MARTGIRLDTDRIKKKLAKLGADVNAETFRPEVIAYAKATLETCIDMTPARDEKLIQGNQEQQYANRVGYIDSIHWGNADPRLIVKESGVFLFSGGKWYRPDLGYRMPDSAWSDYQYLEQEHQRRLQISERAFVENRKQARFLYKKSWVQVALSIGITLRNATSQIIKARTRRKPAKEPVKGYAQIRGGDKVISVVVRNDFLDQPSRFKPFSGKAILAAAQRLHRARFMADVYNKTRRIMRAVARV